MGERERETGTDDTMERASRRVGQTKRHLLSGSVSSGGSSSSSSSASSTSSAAQATRSVIENTSYYKRHYIDRDEPVRWTKVSIQLQGEKLSETIYEKSEEGIAKITINRPERRNAFTPRTILELISCLEDAKEDKRVAAVILTGKGTSAFCRGGDQAVRDVGGYVGKDGVPRLNFLDLQVVLRRISKPVIAMVAGHAVGGGHIIHMLCDMTISADNAIYGQTGPKVGSFDAGWGCSVMA